MMDLGTSPEARIAAADSQVNSSRLLVTKAKPTGVGSGCKMQSAYFPGRALIILNEGLGNAMGAFAKAYAR